MPRAITNQDVRSIIEMIRNWPKSEPFKWESICIGSQSILGYKPTRQALHKKPALMNAYQVKKKQLTLAKNKLSEVTRPRTTLEAMERIIKLQDENDQLKAEIAKMAEIAQRFIYNATVQGLKREQLMRPLEKKKL